MFQKAVSGMEKKLFARMSPRAYQAVKEASKLGAIAGSIYGVADLASKFLGKLAAYGDFKDGQYFCNSAKLYLEKIGFSAKVDQIEGNLQGYISNNQGSSVAEQSNYLLNTLHEELNLAGKIAKCLTENHVNPDSVTQFSKHTQEVLSYNYDKLAQIAPELVKHATIPEFDLIVKLILAGAVGIGVAYKLLSKRYGDLFHK